MNYWILIEIFLKKYYKNHIYVDFLIFYSIN